MNRRGADRTGPLGGSGLVGMWGASSLIKSIQYGTISMSGSSGTAAITAVDTANSFVLLNGRSSNWSGGSGAQYFDTQVELTNSTTVTAYRITSGGITVVAAFVVVELMPGVARSIQSGLITIGTGTTNTATVTSVNTAKAWMIWTGNRANATSDDSGLSYLTLTNSTTITATRGGTTGGGFSNGGYCLVEMF